MAEISRQEARNIVNDVRQQNGGITEEERRQTIPAVLRSYDNLLTIAGSSARVLATELYSTATRFVFELIQNAEDNSYDTVLTRHEAPFLRFTLSHDRIVIDSNEDGFEERHVRAVCGIGQSTKAPTGGYIGEKGIGFKSVFRVANRVNIQSGPFSFSFEHRREDSGMGMITPNTQEHEVLPADVRSRITLILVRPDDFSDRERDFTEIPDTLILFLSKLKKISVLVQPREGPSSTALYERYENESNSSVKLINAFNNTVEESFYHIEKRTLSNLPEDPSRNGRRNAEVILAFPVDAASRPVIRPQYVFSFLPLRQEGLNFLIQSDFVTQASREGIRRSDWNEAIRNGICEVFVDAVRYFCSQPSLQYTWLCYIPGPGNRDVFWGRLREMVVSRLQNYPILLTRGGVLKYPRGLQHLSARHCDQYGEPLFDDLNTEIYLSPLYPWSERLDDLKSLGVTNISYPSLLARLDPYLNGSHPRILEPTFDDDWHTRVANLLMRALSTKDINITDRIKKMRLIPLSDGTLSSNKGGCIYFPDDSEGNSIPTDLGLLMVGRAALQNETRRSLFEKLGVSHCDPAFVKDRILRKYNRRGTVTLNNSISHLHYLYQTTARGESLDHQIFLMNQDRMPIYRIFVTFGERLVVDNLYFETPGEYGTQQLAQKLQSAAREQGRQGFKIHFIHPSYVEAAPPDVRSDGRSWERWLEDMASVRRIPKFKESAMPNRISKLFRDVVSLRPEILIGLLKTYWDSYERDLTPEIIEAIQSAEVPCQGTNSFFSLRSTHFPSAELREFCSRATILDKFEFFLAIPPAWTTDTTVGWEFLENFGVGLKPDLQFFKDIFHCLREEFTPSQAQTGYFAIYEEVSRRFHGERSDEIREMFNENSAVCLPADAARRARSTTLRKCVWNGLRCLRAKHALAVHEEYSQNPDVAYLFRNMLRLRDAGRTTYINELKYRKTNQFVSLEDLCAIYEEVENGTQNEEAWGSVRMEFEEHGLIYVPSESSWHSPASCVWETAPRIGRQYGISTPYARLERFFVRGLSIQTPTASTYVEQLQVLAEERPPNNSAIKSAIHNINTLHPTDADLDCIKSLRCLPVKMANGAVELARPASQFFIADRIEYETAFQGKVPIMDFLLGDVRRLKPFLTALELGNRYMSSATEETTTVVQPDSEPSASLTHAFRLKSKFFYRCACHYGGDRAQENGVEVYQMFQNAGVYESEGFQKTLKLSQGGLTATAESSRGVLHVEVDDGTLQLFVPRNSRERNICYASQLPKALVRYLGITDPTATGIFHVVISSSTDIIDDVLDENGIIQVPDIDIFGPESNTLGALEPDELDTDDLITTPASSEDRATGASQLRPSAPRPIPANVLHSPARENFPPVEVLSAEPIRESRPSPTWAGDGRPGFQSSSHPDPEIIPPLASTAQYVQVLGKVIEAGRRGVFPSTGALDFQNQAGNLPSADGDVAQGSPFGIRSQNRIEHDIKIGAAGELYIFVLLLQLGLSGFSRPNWQSNIRNRVSVHPEYRDLTAWNGAETADIVYNDTDSTLTRLLVSNGYLPRRGQWETACPEYFMEVKSTIGACETPFYMSYSQYRRMQSMKLPASPSANTRIYIIFRVFNLGKDNMSVRVYVDPESLRIRRELRFTPDSYSVAPERPLWEEN